jgi:hypothetical protein
LAFACTDPLGTFFSFSGTILLDAPNVPGFEPAAPYFAVICVSFEAEFDCLVRVSFFKNGASVFW